MTYDLDAVPCATVWSTLQVMITMLNVRFLTVGIVWGETIMKGGYAGKILRVNLTDKSIGTIDTAQYEEYGGGHGIGSAIFWDLAGNQLPFSALDPRNVVTIMAGPFSGVVVPTAAGRCEVQWLGPQAYPIEWFTRSNFGGRFSTQLKYAGWDGIVIEGASEEPVWINIVDN